MSTALRFSRGGSKKNPYYRLVATDSRSPRDSKFIEKLGTYNPVLPKTDAKRFTINEERLKHWLSVGAQPSETVARFLRNAGIITAKPKFVAKAKGTGAKKKAQDAAAAAAAPAAEAPAAPAAEAAAPAA
jgi:small subunit ribosomal protein S16